MSQRKKAYQQLSNEKEFYAQGFLEEPLYLEWQQGVKSYFANEFIALMQTDPSDEERLWWLLKKQPALIKVILHPTVMKRIKPWYQQHPSADFKRQKRQQEALVDTLYILCARYKKQLRSTILNVSNGLIGISLEDNIQEKEKNESIPTDSHLNLTTSQNKHLHRALKHYQVIIKLEQTLMGDHSCKQKLDAFMRVFEEALIQKNLHQYPPNWVITLFKKLVSAFKFEQWLTSTKPIKDETISFEQHLLTELRQKVKKISLC